MQKVSIYTDGACSGNPGPGGWGAVLIYKGVEKEISGYEEDTTNNRMELLSAIKALRMLKRPCDVSLYTDSSYFANAFNQRWVENWKRNGWRTSGKKEVANKDLWLELIELFGMHEVKLIKVKGHSDNEYNNKADRLAVNAIKEMTKAIK